jgi:CheY-like chemotaxis protein
MNIDVGRVDVRQVLYVEDQPINAMLMRALFGQRPHLQLLIAEDGAKASAIAETLNPSLLLLDEQLPDCRGSELLPWLRVRFGWRDVPAISVTAEPDFSCEGTTFSEIWHKPLDLQHVLRRLDQWVPAAGVTTMPGWEPMAMRDKLARPRAFGGG